MVAIGCFLNLQLAGKKNEIFFQLIETVLWEIFSFIIDGDMYSLHQWWMHENQIDRKY